VANFLRKIFLLMIYAAVVSGVGFAIAIVVMGVIILGLTEFTRLVFPNFWTRMEERQHQKVFPSPLRQKLSERSIKIVTVLLMSLCAILWLAMINWEYGQMKSANCGVCNDDPTFPQCRKSICQELSF